MNGDPVTEGGGDSIRLQHLLYPTDFSELSLYALRYAISFANRHAATLVMSTAAAKMSGALVNSGDNAKNFGGSAICKGMISGGRAARL